MKELWSDHRVLICVGTGGVGKTTISACLAIAAAQAGKKVLVLTIDPSKRLATALGLTSTDDQIVQVPGSHFRGELYASVMDPSSSFERFISRSLNNEEMIQKLKSNALYQQLSTSLSGSQEFTSMQRLLEVVESKEFDLVILDTPPTQNAQDFLQAPEKIYALFQKAITKWFRHRSSKGFFNHLLSRGTQAVFHLFEKVTGSDFVTKLSEFFDSVSTLEDQIRFQGEGVKKLLGDDKTGFVLVTGFDELKLKEASQFLKDLEREKFHLRAVVVNRAFPTWYLSGEEQIGQEGAVSKLWDHYKMVKDYYKLRLEAYSQFEAQLRGDILLIKLPELNQEVSGLTALNNLTEEIQQRYSRTKEGGEVS